MYTHAHHDSRIFELYREIARASQETLGLSVADYFGFLQSRWEELAQYEPLSDFPVAAATIVSQRLARQHTYQFLMGLNFEVLNERRRRLIQASPVISPVTTPIVDQMVFAASGSGPRPSGGTSSKRKGKCPPRTSTMLRHPRVMSLIYLIFSLSLAYCSLNWGPCFSSNPRGPLPLWL
ncbi:hypothetical protein Acr_14g0007170 [Actinidia rufa]|uniref:Uncharacterized protein n=1 Tax=Actinidia rufa TaxID=165716 RepID=A0A7J0FQT6_9ERIC|nr:hypothetical protein Acr_14g0007170 [Actinidia rufa]